MDFIVSVLGVRALKFVTIMCLLRGQNMEFKNKKLHIFVGYAGSHGKEEMKKRRNVNEFMSACVPRALL